MKRRIANKAVLLTATPLPAWVGSPAQAAARKAVRPAVVGIPAVFPADRVATFIGPMKARLQDLGWVEKRDITFEIRSANRDMTRLPAVAEEVVGLNPALIWTVSTPVALAAQRATATIPIVFIAVSDPVGVGLARSLSAPGTNATGLTDLQRDYGAKLLEFLRQLLPRMSRVALMSNPLNPADRLIHQELQRAATGMNMQLLAAGVARAEALNEAFAFIAREGAEAVIVSGDLLIANFPDRIDEFLAQSRLPAAYLEASSRRSHGVLSYGVVINELVRGSAVYVDRILRGAKPENFPIEQPTRLDLVINIRAANALGIHVPQSLRLRANEVIE
jgi:putative ABC transport system substrate-binding protein